METTELKTLKLHKHIVSCRLFDLVDCFTYNFYELDYLSTSRKNNGQNYE